MTPRPFVYIETRHERSKSGSKWPFWRPIWSVGQGGGREAYTYTPLRFSCLNLLVTSWKPVLGYPISYVLFKIPTFKQSILHPAGNNYDHHSNLSFYSKCFFGQHPKESIPNRLCCGLYTYCNQSWWLNSVRKSSTDNEDFTYILCAVLRNYLGFVHWEKQNNWGLIFWLTTG